MAFQIGQNRGRQGSLRSAGNLALVRRSGNFHNRRRGLTRIMRPARRPRGTGMSIDQLLAAMDEVLEQGEALLTGLSDAQYAHAAMADGSIGAHYRHSLE